MSKILIVEDADDSFEIVSHILSRDHQLTRAKSVAEAKALFADTYDLLVLDVGLPDGDGFELCHWIRGLKRSEIPIVFVSAKTSTESCITGFTSGGDDYIYKPFHPSEFLARIQAKLRSIEMKSKKALVLKCNGIKMDLSSQKVFLTVDERIEEIFLTPIEFKILHLLIQSPGSAVSRDHILDVVWGKEIYVYPRSVDTHVSKLRKKLKENGNLISSVHGRGYRLNPGSAESVHEGSSVGSIA